MAFAAIRDKTANNHQVDTMVPVLRGIAGLLEKDVFPALLARLGLK